MHKLSSSLVFRLAFGTALAIAASTISASATTVLTDNSFSNVTITSSFASDAGTKVSGSVCGSCGNTGGPALESVENATGSSAMGAIIADVGFIDNLLSYNPAIQGAISSIAFSDVRSVTIAGGPSITEILHVDPAIEQNGNIYLARIAAGSFTFPGSTGFVSESFSGLTASDFVLFDVATGTFDAGNPNFSSSADSILFGLVPYSTGLEAGELKTSISDDLSLGISQTPLPAALPLFGTGLGLMGLLARRKKRKNSAA